jgi:ribulose kinase
MASDMMPGASGLVISDNWLGNRTPYRDPTMKGVVYGLTPFHRPEEIFRALLEAVALGGRLILETFLKFGIPISKIRMSGGATKSRVWPQIFADVLEFPIEVLLSSEASALGSAICAATGSGTYDSLEEAAKEMAGDKSVLHPNPNFKETYTLLYSQYQQLLEISRKMTCQ